MFFKINYMLSPRCVFPTLALLSSANPDENIQHTTMPEWRTVTLSSPANFPKSLTQKHLFPFYPSLSSTPIRQTPLYTPLSNSSPFIFHFPSFHLSISHHRTRNILHIRRSNCILSYPVISYTNIPFTLIF